MLCYTLSLSSPVNCSDPTVPRNGSIEPYQNTTEGAEIFIRCNPGFVPAERMRTLCRADGRWNPDPTTVVCTCELKKWWVNGYVCMEFLSFFSVSCGTPTFAGRVDVELFNSTTVGSEIVYQCQSGLLPEGRMTSVCGGDGRWNPDPATLMCKGKTYVCITRQTKFCWHAWSYVLAWHLDFLHHAANCVVQDLQKYSLGGAYIGMAPILQSIWYLISYWKITSCSKLWSSKTSWKWNYCKLYQYSGGVSSALPV